ncbi:MAG TPA: RNA polymerase sigma factor [Vicinamibacterales bacterium]
MSIQPLPVQSSADDAELAARVAAGDQAAFEALMRRHNGRLFRIARAILREDTEAEDALQEAYLDAYRHMAGFRGQSSVGTWLTRLLVNRALMRLRRNRRDRVVVPFPSGRDRQDDTETTMADRAGESPMDATLRAEIRRLIERRLDQLPVAFRTVFVMREVDGMSVEETAECLGIPPATVRTRLFRARALLRQALASDIDAATIEMFRFDGERCDRIVAGVRSRVAEGVAPAGDTCADPHADA